MSYTCISCRVAFTDGELQRAHYKSDWHRYNLKRKVADMPPVTADNFQERVLAQRAAAEQPPGQADGCGVCNKRFSSANAQQNHLQSHKHQQAQKAALLAAQRKVEQMNQKNLEKGLEEGPGQGRREHDARNQALQQALRAPPRARGGAQEGAEQAPRQRAEKPPRLVWLEEQARRREDEGGAEDEEWEDLEEEEEEEVEEGEEGQAAALPGALPVTHCLFCCRRSRSLLRNVAHMSREHSFFIPDLDFLQDLEGLLRYLGEKVGAGKVCLWCNQRGRSFYSTQAVQSHMTDKSHCKLFTDGDAALEFADFYDFRSSYPDRKEGRDDEEDEELPEERTLAYDEERLELTLPSGARVGHRALIRYYKQRFGAPRAAVPAHHRSAVGRVLRQYRALGWAGQGGGVAQRQRNTRYVQTMKAKWRLKVGLKHNSTQQKHFRAQVMF